MSEIKPKILAKLRLQMNYQFSRLLMALGAGIGILDWSVGGTSWSAVLLNKFVRLWPMIWVLAVLCLLGILAKSSNKITRRYALGDAINFFELLSSMLVASVMVLLGLAPVAFACWIWTGGDCALFSTVGALYFSAVLLWVWLGVTVLHTAILEKYELSRQQQSLTEMSPSAH